MYNATWASNTMLSSKKTNELINAKTEGWKGLIEPTSQDPSGHGWEFNEEL